MKTLRCVALISILVAISLMFFSCSAGGGGSSSGSTSSPSPSPSDTTYDVVEESWEVELQGETYTFTVYRPDASGAFPGIIIINGPLSAEEIAQNGYFVVTGDFSELVTEDVDELIDAMEAHDRCTDKIGDTGHSWGASMSMDVAAKTKKIDAVVELSGLVSDDIDLTTDMPNPVYFITGENDDLATPEETQQMYDDLVAGGQEAEIYIVPGEGHSFSDSAVEEIQGRAIDFFDKYLQ